MTNQREQLLRQIATVICRIQTSGPVRVAIDGVDGAGKTCLADELAGICEASGRTIIRASVDGFHNPRSIRYRRGRMSPEGFYRDSYDYATLKALLLDPLSPGGSQRYRVAAFDHRLDQPVDMPERAASPDDILLFDGIFLHRPELLPCWDYSLFLDVGFAFSLARCAQRDNGAPDPEAPSNRRYVQGQKLYLREVCPEQHTSVVINNDDLDRPFVVSRSGRLTTRT